MEHIERGYISLKPFRLVFKIFHNLINKISGHIIDESHFLSLFCGKRVSGILTSLELT